MTWVQDLYTVDEGDGLVTTCLQLNEVDEPTQEEVWVSLFTTNSDIAEGKLGLIIIISCTTAMHHYWRDLKVTTLSSFEAPAPNTKEN